MYRLTHFPFAATFYGRTTFTRLISYSILNDFTYSSLKSSFDYAGFKGANAFECDGSSKSRVQFYSSSTTTTTTTKRLTRKRKSEPELAVVEPEKVDDSFFVVRKGDIIGVYNNFADCQAQVGSSIHDPPVSIYKGYSLKKDAEDYLASCGLKNAIYSIRAEDLKDDLFGMLIPCPPHKTCILEFDGASKGNPGQAGAGAILRANDGSVISKLREGLGIVTCNVAEYRALILGLKHALRKGYTSILVKGDSKLVCLQIQGIWRVRHEKMSELWNETKKLKHEFLSFQICHVLRHLNSEADAQANLAVSLAVGEVVEEV